MRKENAPGGFGAERRQSGGISIKSAREAPGKRNKEEKESRSMKSVKRRILSWILTVVMICAMLPITALAAGVFARVGDTTYAKMDAAVETAPEG